MNSWGRGWICTVGKFTRVAKGWRVFIAGRNGRWGKVFDPRWGIFHARRDCPVATPCRLWRCTHCERFTLGAKGHRLSGVCTSCLIEDHRKIHRIRSREIGIGMHYICARECIASDRIDLVEHGHKMMRDLEVNLDDMLRRIDEESARRSPHIQAAFLRSL